MKYIHFMLLLLAFHISACKHEQETKQEQSTFIVSHPIVKDTVLHHEYVCQVRSFQHIELRTLEKGYLQDIHVDEGQMAKKGQLLFKIMPLVYQAEAQKAQAELTFAELEYQNTKALADSNIVSKNELALAHARLQKVKSEYDLAKVHLGFTEIRAPFDGIVGRFNDVRKGSLLDEGELLTTLSDNSKLWVYFNVPEAEYISYAKQAQSGQPVKVQLMLANNELFEVAGVIETIEGDFNNETGNIAFRATFPNSKGLLRHGQTGNILLPVPVKNAMLIPQSATYEILDKKFVYVVDENHKVNAREITVEHEMPHVYSVSGGLAPSDKILVEGIRKVKNGDVIHYEEKTFYAVIHELKNLKSE
ncbi:MAG: efflux RND transporter periplasmic adaptor subunit [Saprospiraceae bacterium]|nr:efflux RND transporter periplasmic adaptor subunit [Saprospiraceae bacterium]